MPNFWIICSLLLIAPYVAEGILPFMQGILGLKMVVKHIIFKLANSKILNIAGSVSSIISIRSVFSKGHRRHNRSVDTIEDSLLQANMNDADDCAKKLICLINATPEESMSTEEKIVANMFSFQDDIDLSKSTVEFDLAAFVGRKGGPSQCMSIYARCPHDHKDLIEALRAS